MHDESYVRIPLRARDGSIRDFVLIDLEDAHLAEQRWQLVVKGRYAGRSVLADGKKRMIYLHREVLGLGPDDKREVDHIDGRTLDCRRANLRVCTHAQNLQNRGSQPGATSRHRGVYWDSRRQKWAVQIGINGRKHSLGRFASETQAAAVARAFIMANMPFATPGR